MPGRSNAIRSVFRAGPDKGRAIRSVGPEPCGLSFYAIIANQNENLGIAKIDYQINSKQSIFGRYFVAHSEIPSSYTGTQLSVLNAGTDDEVNSVVTQPSESGSSVS